MPEEELPHYKLKQNLLHGKEIKPEERSRWGQKFLAAGWLYDAIEFFAAAKDSDGLQQVRTRVVREGNVFLFKKILKALEVQGTDAEWKEIGDCAFELGKLQYAREGYRMASDRKGLDKVDELLKPPAPEAPKEEPIPPQP